MIDLGGLSIDAWTMCIFYACFALSLSNEPWIKNYIIINFRLTFASKIETNSSLIVIILIIYQIQLPTASFFPFNIIIIIIAYDFVDYRQHSFKEFRFELIENYSSRIIKHVMPFLTLASINTDNEQLSRQGEFQQIALNRLWTDYPFDKDCGLQNNYN